MTIVLSKKKEPSGSFFQFGGVQSLKVGNYVDDQKKLYNERKGPIIEEIDKHVDFYG